MDPNGIIAKSINKFIASSDVVDKRMIICNSCPQLIPITTNCKECGCFMNIKTKLLTATCPLGKW